MREELKINTDKINSGSLCSARKVLFFPVITARATETKPERSRFSPLRCPVCLPSARRSVEIVGLVSLVILAAARATTVPRSVMTLGAGVWWGGPRAPARPRRGGEPPDPGPVVLLRGNASQNRHRPQDSALWAKEDAYS